MFPAPAFADTAARSEAVAAYHGLHAERYLAGADRSRVAEVGGAVVGVALWRWPDDPSWPGVLPTTRGCSPHWSGPSTPSTSRQASP